MIALATSTSRCKSTQRRVPLGAGDWRYILGLVGRLCGGFENVAGQRGAADLSRHNRGHALHSTGIDRTAR